jgi:hypothetical protein
VRILAGVTRPYSGPAPGARRPDSRAHGWAAWLEVRQDKAARITNVNGLYHERGGWTPYDELPDTIRRAVDRLLI